MGILISASGEGFEHYVYNERDTASFIHESIGTLDNLIYECVEKSSYACFDDELRHVVSEFVIFSELLFSQYLFYSANYSLEVPRFSLAYERSIELSAKLLSKGLIKRKELNNLLSCWKGVSRLLGCYASSTNDKEAVMNYKRYVKKIERSIKEIKKA